MNNSKGLAALFTAVSETDFLHLDLSVNNTEISNLDLSSPEKHWEYITHLLHKKGKKIAYGGYLEQRNLYKHNDLFQEKEYPRNIHLGIDFWVAENTPVLAPFDGVVHSFANNSAPGDYGPTIVLAHEDKGDTFYTLYGHLTIESLAGLVIGKIIRKGEQFTSIGAPLINGGYAPHLHFQIIRAIGTYKGDYPGVCCAKEAAYYAVNCPDPVSYLTAELE